MMEAKGRGLEEMSPKSSPELIPAIPSHPQGVKPAGNAYTAKYDLRRAASSFASLPDELIIQILECLEAPSLLRVGSTCKAMYAFAVFEDLWKGLFIQSRRSSNPFTWYGTWRNTYFAVPSSQNSHISCSNLFSDLLYRPFFCAHAPLDPYTTSIPKQNLIPRLADLSAADFSSEWVDRPFILTEPVHGWPLYHSWSTEHLLERYGDVKFRAEAVDWPLREYVRYMGDSSDESPLYLFDSRFVEKLGLAVGREAAGGYWAPECFGEDLFAVLDQKRPDCRWLIIGPERSGSTFHKDPNATSAWNAVIRGAKYWIMFPPSKASPPPPGVFVSADQSEVTSPLSIAEWLLGFHAEARKTKGCVEGICTAGEVLHVPSGWWHLVVNLAPSIAITQNFIPRQHLRAALSFLRDRPSQVSGFAPDVADPFRAFVEGLRSKGYGDLLGETLAGMERGGLGVGKMKRKRRWDEVVNGADEKDEIGGGGGDGFSFSFAGADDDDVP